MEFKKQVSDLKRKLEAREEDCRTHSKDFEVKAMGAQEQISELQYDIQAR